MSLLLNSDEAQAGGLAGSRWLCGEGALGPDAGSVDGDSILLVVGAAGRSLMSPLRMFPGRAQAPLFRLRPWAGLCVEQGLGAKSLTYT